MRRRLCIFMPYHNAWMYAGQFFAIAGVLLSWVWYATTLIGFIAMAVQLCLCCCRQRAIALLATALVCLMAMFLALYSGWYFRQDLPDHAFCRPYFFVNPNNRRFDETCPEERYILVAYVDAACWLASAVCLFVFVSGGKHGELERKWKNEDAAADDIENNNNNNNTAHGTRNGATIALATAVIDHRASGHQRGPTAIATRMVLVEEPTDAPLVSIPRAREAEAEAEAESDSDTDTGNAPLAAATMVSDLELEAEAAAIALPVAASAALAADRTSHSTVAAVEAVATRVSGHTCSHYLSDSERPCTHYA